MMTHPTDRTYATVTRDGHTYGILVVPDCSGTCWRASVIAPGGHWSALPLAYDTLTDALMGAVGGVARLIDPAHADASTGPSATAWPLQPKPNRSGRA